MDEYQQTIKLENERFEKVIEVIKIVAIGIVAIFVTFIVASAILLAQHTGPKVCNECNDLCVRNGPTHFELLLGN